MSRRETLNALRMSGLLVHMVRHGQSLNTHHPDSENSPPNPPLTSVGIVEITKLSARLLPLGIHRLISSPMRRAIETATILADSFDLPIEVWTQCHEHRATAGYLCWGARELRTRYRSLLLPSDLSDDDWSYGNEHLDQAIARADLFLHSLRRDISAGDMRHLVVVTHGAFTRIVLARILGANPQVMAGVVEFDNASVTTLHVTHECVRILSLNDTSHLIGAPDLDPLLGLTR